MASTPMRDCTTGVEDAKLLYSGDYMKLVSSGVSGLGAVNTWPPAARPEPYSWTDPKTHTTWTLVSLDRKWMYRDGKKNLFISPSNLYDLMGVAKEDLTGNVAPNQSIPGLPNATNQKDDAAPYVPPSGWNLSTTVLGGLSLGWAIVLGVGGVLAFKSLKKKRRSP